MKPSEGCLFAFHSQFVSPYPCGLSSSNGRQTTFGVRLDDGACFCRCVTEQLEKTFGQQAHMLSLAPCRQQFDQQGKLRQSLMYCRRLPATLLPPSLVALASLPELVVSSRWRRARLLLQIDQTAIATQSQSGQRPDLCQLTSQHSGLRMETNWRPSAQSRSAV